MTVSTLSKRAGNLRVLSVPQAGSTFYRRRLSSQWKAQRDADIFADKAICEGMRSRAAYKLEEINKKFNYFLRPGAYVVDLGAAPGGFSMMAAKFVRLDNAINRWNSVSHMDQHRDPPDIKRTLGGFQVSRRYGQLICVDRVNMDVIPGAIFIQGDMHEDYTHRQLQYAMGSQEADVVLSDMAPNTTGERETNHVRIMELADMSFRLSRKVLRNGGTFVCKIFSGADEISFRKSLREWFTKVKPFRPSATRRTSPEVYYVAQGFVPAHLKP